MLVDVRGLLVADCLVMHLAVVEHLEGVPERRGFVQHTCVVPKPREHLLCRRRVHVLQPLGQPRHMQRVALACLLVPSVMEAVDGPILHLLEFFHLQGLRHEGAVPIQHEAVNLLVHGQDLQQ